MTSDALHIVPEAGNSAGKGYYFPFKARGGERHLSMIDWGEDGLPTSSKSCHHGGEILPAQKGSVRATLSGTTLRFHIEWEDRTKDTRVSRWRPSENRWVTGKDDGVSLVFSRDRSFTCSATCHMTNWQVEEGRFASDYRMFDEKAVHPIILLRPGKTGNRPLLGMLGGGGKKTPAGREMFIINSRKAAGRQVSLALYQSVGTSDDRPADPGAGDALFTPDPSNVFLDGEMRHRMNHWQAEIVVDTARLGYADLKKGDTIFVAIALFDGTHTNHSITETFAARVY